MERLRLAVVGAGGQCIMKGEQAYPSLTDGWRNLVVGQAILDSCAQGQVVTVPR